MAAVALSMTAVLWARVAKLTPGSPGFAFPGDHHAYLYMATHGAFRFHVAPYCWRVLGPVIAGGLPGSVTVGFQVVTFVSIWLTAVVVYLLARRLGFSPVLALSGMMLFLALGWAVKFNLHDFWLTDPLAFLFVALAVLMILTRRDAAFALCLAIGVLAKESVILVAPLFYAFRADRPIDVAAARRTVALALPAVAVVVAVRLGIPAWNGRPGYVDSLPPGVRSNAHAVPSYVVSALMRMTLAKRSMHWGTTAVRALSSFGLVIPVLALLGGPPGRRLFLRFLPFLALVGGQLLFATNTERLIVLAFPVVILLALAGAQRLRERHGAGEMAFLALAGLCFALELVSPGQWEPGPFVQLVALVPFLPLMLRRAPVSL